MTIIIGAIAKKFGIVGSDSRIFMPAILDNGKILKEAEPKKGDFDKTFEAKGGKIIGAIAGLMEINHKDTRKHIIEIINNEAVNEGDLLSVIETLKVSLKRKLEKEEREVIVSERLLNVIIISSTNFDEREFSIFTLDFKPVEENQIFHIDVTVDHGISKRIGEWQIYKSIRGDDGAVRSSTKSIDNNLKTKRKITFGFIKTLVETAIKTGINNAGQHKYGPEKSCGGKINIRKVNKIYS